MKEKELSKLKEEKVDLNVFSEEGKIEKHEPLEFLSFIGQPPFKGDTKHLKVMVRWKFFEKENY